MFSLEGKRIYVAGHQGMVGSALLRRLVSEDCTVVTSARNLDLRNQVAVNGWFETNRPEVVILAAAKVGGILANDRYPAEFLYDNLMIQANVIEAARVHGSQKLLFLGSSCIYPKHAAQPISEAALMTGPLESTNEWYAVAKIAGIKLCQSYRRHYGCDFISAMPTNLYGPGDNYDLESSHVLPALIRKIHEAKETGSASVRIWGSGKPLREFLHVDDLADACIFLLCNYSGESHVNVGSGEEVSIADLADLIKQIIGFNGHVSNDPDKPDGTPRKLLDSSKLQRLGWEPSIALRGGVSSAYEWFKANQG
ncbi:GDP-L-fucose synthase [Altererythrobacter aquiaggeris]|uniref:GDP-L-fucose synthase n=1 Tax=Aestuarierythrobacter aquiaggeris TaxID=1898396 RepID=UPI00301AAAEF